MIAYVLSNGTVTVIGFIGNLLVILIVVLNRVFHNMRSFFLASLALSDFLFVTLNLISRVVSVAHREWIFGETWCYGLAFLERITYVNTILHLCAVSYERYRAIVKEPLTYDGRITLKKVIISISVLWIIPTVIALGPFLGWGGYDYNPDLYACGQRWDSQTAFPLLVTTFVGPFLFIFVLNYQVFQVARRLERQVNFQLGSVGDGQFEGDSRQQYEVNIGARNQQEENQETGQVITEIEASQDPPELRKAGQVNTGYEHSQPDAGCSQHGSSQHGVIIRVSQHQSDGSDIENDPEEIKKAGTSEELKPSQSQAKQQSAKRQEETSILAIVQRRKPRNAKNRAQGALQLVNILKECKAARDVLVVIGIFLVCYLPMWCHGIYRTLMARPYSNEMLLAVNTVFGTTAIWNPIIYSVRKKEFRKAIKRLFTIQYWPAFVYVRTACILCRK